MSKKKKGRSKPVSGEEGMNKYHQSVGHPYDRESSCWVGEDACGNTIHSDPPLVGILAGDSASRQTPPAPPVKGVLSTLASDYLPAWVPGVLAATGSVAAGAVLYGGAIGEIVGNISSLFRSRG